MTEPGVDLRHALSVARRVCTLDAKVVALLHDAVEDGACSLGEISASLLPDEIVRAVDVLTRRRHESYRKYIVRVAHSGSSLARRVKLADLQTNLERCENDPEGGLDSLIGRYQRAIEFLLYDDSADEEGAA